MLSQIFFALLQIFIAADVVTGQYFYSGHCPKHIRAQANFNFNKYKGLWFEVEKYHFLPEITGKCIYVRYLNMQPDGISFQADIVQIQLGTMKKIPSPSAGKIVSTDGSAQINLMVNVLVPLTNIPMAAFKYPYWIIETDYDDYSIKWACEEFRLITGAVINMQSMWILTRTRHYPEDLRLYIHERLRQFGLQPELLELTDQKNCPSAAADDYLNEPVDLVPPPPLLKSNLTDEEHVKSLDS